MKKPWVEDWGFAFDPFEHLEASQDANLHRYLVGHRGWSAVFARQPHLVFSPPGGGKTALRLYLYRTCWTGGQGQRPFALHYSLPDCWENSALPYLSTLPAPDLLHRHLAQIVRTGARSLFFGLAYFPLLFLNRCSPSRRALLAEFIIRAAPETRWYLDVIRETRNPNTAAVQAGNAYMLNHQPDFALLEVFLREWEKALPKPDNPVPLDSPHEALEQELFLIQEVLGFPGVFLLLDGIDGMLEYSEAHALKILSPLIEQVETWAERGIFLKAFLPKQLFDMRDGALQELSSRYPPVFISWQPDDLVELIRARIRVATGGAFDSFASVSAPPLCYEDVEHTLISHLPQDRLLPREALALVRELLDCYTRRMLQEFHPLKRLELEDLDLAVRRYREGECFSLNPAVQSGRGGWK